MRASGIIRSFARGKQTKTKPYVCLYIYVIRASLRRLATRYSVIHEDLLHRMNTEGNRGARAARIARSLKRQIFGIHGEICMYDARALKRDFRSF